MPAPKIQLCKILLRKCALEKAKDSKASWTELELKFVTLNKLPEFWAMTSSNGNGNKNSDFQQWIDQSDIKLVEKL